MKVKRLNLYLTTQCGLRCKHCCVGEELAYSMTMDFAKAKQIVSVFLSNNPIEEIALLGGEPTLVIYFREIIDFIRSKFKGKIIVISNGQKTDPFKRILPQSLDKIAISFEGCTPETNDKIRGAGSFKKAIDTLNYLIQNSYPAAITYTVNKVNLNESIKAIHYFDSLGIKEINFHLISNNGNTKNNQELLISPHEWLHFYNLAINIQTKNGIMVRIPKRYVSMEEFQKKKNEGYSCLLNNMERAHVFPDGRIFGCCLFIDTNLHAFEFKDKIIKTSESERTIQQKNHLSSCVAADFFQLNTSGFQPICVHSKEVISTKENIQEAGVWESIPETFIQ